MLEVRPFVNFVDEFMERATGEAFVVPPIATYSLLYCEGVTVLDDPKARLIVKGRCSVDHLPIERRRSNVMELCHKGRCILKTLVAVGMAGFLYYSS
jgi:hypothetical protein